MLSNTQQLDLCQYMKEYENDSFFSKIVPIFFWPPPRIWGRGGHTQPKLIFYPYFVTINKLKWLDHITFIKNKISKSIGIINNNFK